MRTFFVVIAVSRVLVQIERAVGSLVNPKLDGSCGLLVGILNFRAKGNDRTCTYVEWNAVESSIRLQYGADENGRSKHELIPDVAGIRISPPVHHQRPLDRVVLMGDAPGEGVDIRHQPISKPVVVDQDRPDFVEGPDLILRPVPVSTENRTKYSVLEPSCVEFLEFWILKRIVVRRPIAPDIRCPIRISGERKVQPGGHLMAQSPVRAIHVARPYRRPDSLLAEES